MIYKIANLLKKNQKLDLEELRRLAVKASCDPRTIAAVAAGDVVKGLAGERARAALIAAGHLAADSAESEGGE